MSKAIFRGILADFLLLLLAFTAVSVSITASRKILYGAPKAEPFTLTVITKPLDHEYDGQICRGDELYDVLTKACIGYVEELSSVSTEEGIRFTLTITARAEPRTNALRISSQISTGFSKSGLS